MGHDWKRWFDGYARDWRAGALTSVAARYAPRFQAIKPGKSATYRNDESFVAWLDQVQRFHQQAGLSSVEIVTLQLTPMGPMFAMVSVLWAVRFEQRSTLRIQFEISYLVSGHATDTPQIVSVISHIDQREAMVANGLFRQEATAG